MRRVGPQHLPPELHPILIATTLLSDELIDGALAELTQAAQNDPNGCWGDFAGFESRDLPLPRTRKFAESVDAAAITPVDRPLPYCFTRVSIWRQPTIDRAQFHLDTDALTAVGGDPTEAGKIVVRALFNIGQYPRSLEYLDIDPRFVLLQARGSTVRYLGRTAGRVRKIDIAARVPGLVSGVLFYSNRVLHSGRDDKRGHAVLALGHEQPAEAIPLHIVDMSEPRTGSVA